MTISEALALLRLTSTTIGRWVYWLSSRGAVVLIGVRHAAARVDDQVAARQEAVRDLDRLVERPPGLSRRSNTSRFMPGVGQLLERRADLVVGRLREVTQLDVAGFLSIMNAPRTVTMLTSSRSTSRSISSVVAAAAERRC